MCSPQCVNSRECLKWRPQYARADIQALQHSTQLGPASHSFLEIPSCCTHMHSNPTLPCAWHVPCPDTLQLSLFPSHSESQVSSRLFTASTFGVSRHGRTAFLDSQLSLGISSPLSAFYRPHPISHSGRRSAPPQPPGSRPHSLASTVSDFRLPGLAPFSFLACENLSFFLLCSPRCLKRLNFGFSYAAFFCFLALRSCSVN